MNTKKEMQWPDILRILLLGNGLINNLAEPEVQANELLSQIRLLQECLCSNDILARHKQLICDEIRRQYDYLFRFNKKLTALLEDYKRDTESEK